MSLQRIIAMPPVKATRPASTAQNSRWRNARFGFFWKSAWVGFSVIISNKPFRINYIQKMSGFPPALNQPLKRATHLRDAVAQLTRQTRQKWGGFVTLSLSGVAATTPTRRYAHV